MSARPGSAGWRRRVPARAWLALLACAVLAAPPLRGWLEASMTRQMLVQIPLLGALGWLLAAAVPPAVRARLAPWNASGVSGLVLASVVALLWMLPRALDAAIDSPWAVLAKFSSVPLLIGLPLALSWPRMGFVVRGVFVLEGIATCFRLGWLYLAAPERLCANYLLDDQQRLGWLLLALGAVLTLAMAGRLMFGRWSPPAGMDEHGPKA